jgi:exodeoxyribonuclease VII large subunit
LTVSQINRYIKRLLTEDALLSGVFVIGELSNVKAHSSGHLYFTLKDASAAVNGVMFRSSAQSLPFAPENGMKTVVGGYISLYEKTGQYQLYAEYMEPAGLGGLQAAFLQLREKLTAEGLFDAARKKPIPAYASHIAVITSPTGAAMWDIIRTIRGRNPGVRITIAPALVQGANAAADIARALAAVNAWGRADVIILGRGGGSMEDLQPFNEEETARAVAASRVPVISAVGHETDFTIADFAADERAPTPTAAAVMAAYNLDDTQKQIYALTESMRRGVFSLLAARKQKLKNLTARRCMQKPLEPLLQRQVHLQTLVKTLDRLINERLARERSLLNHKSVLLERGSPYALWNRGFAAVRAASGNAVTSVGALAVGDRVAIHFKDGQAGADVACINMG